jgi:hypothetical protein
VSRIGFALVCALAVAAAAASAGAWEPDSTHVGLTERAALATRLHARLVERFGRRGGWLESLRLPTERAPGLYERLALVEPASGVVPDRAGRQSALAWLLAGAVIEGLPAAREQNHFYDPLARHGLTGGSGASLGLLLQAGVTQVGGAGAAAPDWILAKDNDLGLEHFNLELARAVVSPSPDEREEHLASALVCAGAMLHVLEDVGEPARVRGDLDELTLPLGGGAGDRGSRAERLAALLYGRLGVPAPDAVTHRPHLRDYFTADDKLGLADLVNASYYSSGTLPAPVQVPSRPRAGEVTELVARASRYPAPRPAQELDLTAASAGPDGHILRGPGGVCLANYRVEGDRLTFAISDECAASQLGQLLPRIGGYAAGFLEHLFRGALVVAVQEGTARVSVASGDPQLGPGPVVFVGEDEAGRRRPLGTVPLRDGRAELAVPAGVVMVYALWSGTDASGEQLVAVGSASTK